MGKHYIIFVLMLINCSSFGQQPFRLSFHHLTREEGLSNNNIFCMHRDSRHFLWLGTPNGLNRFDGVNCKVYKPSNSAIGGVDIKNLVEDKSGNLWIGTEAGLSMYDRQKDDFVNIPSPGNRKPFSSYPYCIDNRGLLWVRITGDRKDGLYTYDPSSKKYTFITSEVAINLPQHQNDSFQEVTSIYCGSKTDFGINRITLIDNKVKKIESFLDGRNGHPARSHVGEYVLAESDSTVWITGTNDGLMKLNTQTNALTIFNQFKEKHITTVFSHITRYKQFLIIGSGEGLYIFDTQTERFVQLMAHLSSDPGSLAANWNETPYIDRDENLFLSQLGFGVDFTNLKETKTEQWLSSTESEKVGLADNHVTHLIHRGDQTWAKMQSAGTLVIDSKGEVLHHYNGFSVLLNDSQNMVWLTTGDQWILVNQKNRIEARFNSAEIGLPADVSLFMVEVGNGEYLVSGNGLYVLRKTGKTFKASPVTDFNKEKLVGCHPIYYDKPSGKIFLSANWWSAFYVLEKKNGEWEIIKKIDPPFRVYWIAPSVETGRIWLCTSKGLVSMNSATYKYTLFTEKDGLPDNVVTNIIPEAKGNYWLVTNRGISHYDSKAKQYRNYTSRDGANSKEYDWYGNFILSDGRVVFGGTDGITVISPAKSRSSNAKPEVQITGFYTNEKLNKTGNYIGERKDVEIKSSESSFEFDLVGIDFGFPQKVKLKYKLEGFDKQWIIAANPVSARYVNIPAGNYSFQAQAVDENDKISSSLKTLSVKVNVPFWKTTWFRAGLVLLLIGLGYVFFKLRLNQVQSDMKHKQEVKHIRAQAEINALRSQMNPHFIFNCMNTIDSYIFLSKTDEASEFLQKFSKLVRMILEYSRQEYVSVEEDLQALELYIQLEQERSNNSFTYEISVDHTLYEKEYLIPSMLFQPFVENAILHGLRHKKNDIGELFVNLKMGRDQLICNIIDNGIGRAAAERINVFRKHQSKSVGVKLTEERIKKLDEIYPGLAYFKLTDIEMENDYGTIVEIGLPLLTLETLKS